MAAESLSAESLQSLLSYDAETGRLFWRTRRIDEFNDARATGIFNTRFAGLPALTAVTAQGYLRGTILGKNYLAHRVAWALFHGEWPCDLIDHINGDPLDNRICNLRAATASQNRRNQKPLARNTSGLKGASWSKAAKKWRAQIRADNNTRHLGYFDTAQDAHDAYCRASAELHREFGRVA